MGFSCILIASSIRICFLPIQLYTQKQQYNQRLLNPDFSDSQSRISRLRKSNNMAILKAENEKMIEMRLKYGINQSKIKNGLFLMQGFLLGVWICLFQRITYQLEDYPQMLNGGFFWFKDLTMPDPYFILPLINSFFMFYNTSCSTLSVNEHFKKMKKYSFIMPFMSFIILTSVQSGFILFYLTTSMFQTTVFFLLRTQSGRKFIGIPDGFLEGSKLYKLVRYKVYMVKIRIKIFLLYHTMNHQVNSK